MEFSLLPFVVVVSESSTSLSTILPLGFIAATAAAAAYFCWRHRSNGKQQKTQQSLMEFVWLCTEANVCV